jgi:hypothetical protein
MGKADWCSLAWELKGAPKFIWAPYAQLYSLAEATAFGLINWGAIGQPR